MRLVDTLPSVGALYQVGGEGITHPLDANTFVVDSVLIECGSRLGYPELKRSLGRLGLMASDIETVIATHGHWDHVSGMELLSEESDARLFVPTEDAEGVESGDSTSTVAYYYEEEVHPIKVAGRVDHGFFVRTEHALITPIRTPWHTPGSVCYRVEQADSVTLIAGDTLYGFYFPSPERSILDDLASGRESLSRLRDEDYDHIAIGHAMLGFRDDVATRLEEAQRQFATSSIISFIKERGDDLPAHIDPWKKESGQIFKY